MVSRNIELIADLRGYERAITWAIQLSRVAP